MVARLFLLLGCLFSAHLWASEAVLLGSSAAEIVLNPYTEIYEDKSGQADFQFVASSDISFTPNPEGESVFGYTPSNFWFRWSVKNQAEEQEWVVVVGSALLDSVEFYRPDLEGGFSKVATGDRTPFTSREVDYRHFAFRLQVPTNEEKRYYLKVNNSGLVEAPLRLMTAENFYKRLVSWLICRVSLFSLSGRNIRTGITRVGWVLEGLACFL